MTPAEIDRLAHAGAALRPDWPLKSLQTMLAGFAIAHPHRSYIDTAHALAAIALDQNTRNPGRLAENGPWWAARPGAERPRPVTSGPTCQICRNCGRAYTEPDHRCITEADRADRAAVVAEAKRVAATARGQYERAMAERETARAGG